MHSGELTDGTRINLALVGPARFEVCRPAHDFSDARLRDLLLDPLKQHEGQLTTDARNAQPLDTLSQQQGARHWVLDDHRQSRKTGREIARGDTTGFALTSEQHDPGRSAWRTSSATAAIVIERMP